MSDFRIALWNVQADQRTAERTRRIRARLESLEADVICLNEGFCSDLPEQIGDHVLTSGLSDWAPERGGARKVILYSRLGWLDSDPEGSPLLPEGRFFGRTHGDKASSHPCSGHCTTMARVSNRRKVGFASLAHLGGK